MLGPIGDSHQSGDWRIGVLSGEQKDVIKPIIIVSADVACLRHQHVERGFPGPRSEQEVAASLDTNIGLPAIAH